MALELDQPIIRSRKTPEKGIEPAFTDPSHDGLVQVKIREKGAGKIFTGVTRAPTDPLSKTNPFPTYPVGEIIWVTPQAAETYDERRWVNLLSDE